MTGRLAVRAVWASALLFFASCRFDPAVANPNLVTCAADADCPTGLRCQVSAGHCVPTSGLDVTLPAVTAAEESLLPHFDNPLPAPTALGPRSTLRVRLETSEAVTTPTVTAPGLSCTARPNSTVSFTVDCTTTPEAVDGPIAMTVHLVDTAQLVADVVLSLKTRLDVTPPPAPDGSPGHLRLRSSPWGDSQTSGKPSLRFVATPGTFTDAVVVQVNSGGTVLGSGPVAADGATTTLDLPLVEGQDFYATSVDGAGNGSAPEKVRDVAWFATFYGKHAGDSFPNPHRFEAFRGETDAVEAVGVTERGEVDGIAEAGGLVSLVSGAGSWRRRSFNVEPDGTGVNPGGAFDPRRARVVRWGGLSRFGTSGLLQGGFGTKVWEWNGHDWLPVTQSDPEGDGDPDPRLQPNMVYSPDFSGVVMYGGNAGQGERQFTDTWLWNGESWRRLADGPPARNRPVIYPDRHLGGVVVFGGQTAAGAIARDAWLLTGAGWQQLDAGAFPPARANAAFATDAVNDVTWLYGGLPVADVWRRTAGTWQPVTATTGLPVSRTEASAAWDDRRNLMVMYGGRYFDGGVSDELWEFDGATWSLRGPSLPGPRTQHTVVYDIARGQTLLFGREVPEVPNIADAGPETTWAYDGRWHLAAQQTDGLATWGSRNLVWNEALGAMQTVGLNAAARPSVATLSDVGWVVTDVQTPLLPTLRARIAYESQQDDLLLFGAASEGSTAEIWRVGSTGVTQVTADAGLTLTEVDSVVSSGKVATVITSTPVTRVQRLVLGNLVVAASTTQALVHPHATATPEGDVLFTGLDAAGNAQSFKFSNSAVTPLPALPLPLGAFGLVYDTARKGPVITGGVTIPVHGINDVYELLGANWARVTVADVDGNGAPARRGRRRSGAPGGLRRHQRTHGRGRARHVERVGIRRRPPAPARAAAVFFAVGAERGGHRLGHAHRLGGGEWRRDGVATAVRVLEQRLRHQHRSRGRTRAPRVSSE